MNESDDDDSFIDLTEDAKKDVQPKKRVKENGGTEKQAPSGNDHYRYGMTTPNLIIGLIKRNGKVPCFG